MPSARPPTRDLTVLRPDTARFVEAARDLTRMPDDTMSDPIASAAYLHLLRSGSARPNPPEAVDSVEDTVIAGVPVRIYRPAGEASHPLVVYLHGGGWVAGDLETNDAACRRIANTASATVISVDYRLAPEHPFPAAVDDAYAVLGWVHSNASALSGDQDRVVVVGSSAGGNLAAAIALRSRDEAGPPIWQQILIYPVLNAALDTLSSHDLATGYLLERRLLEWYWSQYVPHPLDQSTPMASPMAAESLVGLPPTLVITAEFDPLRDEGEQFAQRILREGGDAVAVRFEGQVHGFAALIGSIHDAAEATALISRVIATGSLSEARESCATGGRTMMFPSISERVTPQ